MLGMDTKSNGMWAPATKLRVDFKAQARRGRAMDDDTRELIAQLFTRVGMIIEDVGPVALLAGTGDRAELDEAVAAIEQAAEKITSLASAVRALLAE